MLPRGLLDAVLLHEAVQSVREQTSLVVQLSTGSVHDPRLTGLQQEMLAPPTCDLGHKATALVC